MARPHLLVPLLALLLLSGCSTGPRQYHYDLELKNASDRPISLELLQARSSAIGKVRADLAPGGIYSSAHTTYGDGEYLEARLRSLGAGPEDPWFVFELPRGRIRADLAVVDGRIVLRNRRPEYPEGPP